MNWINPKISFFATLVAVLLALPAPGQPAGDARSEGDTQKPTVRTYDKFPDSRGDHQDFDLNTYDKAPDSDGNDQDHDYVRYRERNPDNNGDRSVEEEEE